MTKERQPSESDRVTVTLAVGQRDALERIAKLNGTKLAFLVRLAVKQLIQKSEAGELKLEVPRGD